MDFPSNGGRRHTAESAAAAAKSWQWLSYFSLPVCVSVQVLLFCRLCLPFLVSNAGQCARLDGRLDVINKLELFHCDIARNLVYFFSWEFLKSVGKKYYLVFVKLYQRCSSRSGFFDRFSASRSSGFAESLNFCSSFLVSSQNFEF